MKHVICALLLCALAGPADAAEPEPRAIAAFVNIVLGACMADKAGSSLMPDPIDPRAVGVPIDAGNKDPRLGLDTLRIPATDGVVYHDRDASNCYVYADGIDAEGAVARIQESLRRSGVPVMAFSDQVADDGAGVRRRTAVYGVMVSPTAPALPLITLSYPVDQPVLMTAGVRAATAE